METEVELNAKIMAITMKIREKHPELEKFIGEMRATIPDENSPEIDIRNLRAYYESLSTMLKKYELERPLVKKN